MQQQRMKFVLVGVAVATLAVYAVSFRLSTTRDRVDQLDTDVLRSAATAACIDLRTAVDALPALPPGAGTDRRAARVGEQDALVQRFTAQVRAVGDKALDADEPSREWLADWESVATARADYVRSGFAGAFTVPIEDGQPITLRMKRIGLEACAVPQALTASP